MPWLPSFLRVADDVDAMTHTDYLELELYKDDINQSFSDEIEKAGGRLATDRPLFAANPFQVRPTCTCTRSALLRALRAFACVLFTCVRASVPRDDIL